MPGTARAGAAAAAVRRRTTTTRGHRRRPGRGLTAAALSSILPGLGQLLAGRWHRGLLMVAGTSALIVLGATVPLAGTANMARLLVQPDALTVLFLVDLVVLGFRLIVVIDAYRCASEPPRASGRPQPTVVWPALVALALLVALTAAPHVVLGYYDLQARGVITEVFAAEPVQEMPPPAPVEGVVAAPPEPDVQAEDAQAVAPRQRVTVALLGGDAGPLRDGLRTDTIMVATSDPRTGRSALFSVPRNLVRVPLPRWVDSPWRCRCFPHPINSLYAWFAERDDLVPAGVDPGAAVLVGSLEELLGLDIDHYLLVDLGGFVEVVDALGGVTIEVQRRIYDQLDSPDGRGEWDAIDLRPGVHHLDGHQALVYVRSRRNADDYQRMGRQRCFLAALTDQADPARVLRVFPRLATIVRNSVESDIPVDDLPGLVELGLGVEMDAVVAVAFVPPAFVDGWDEDGYPVPDVDLVRETVARVLVAPPVPEVAPTEPPSEAPSPSEARAADEPVNLASDCA